MTERNLGEGFSLWLDITRLAAALAVVLFHLSIPQNGGWFRVGAIGTNAVMIFFVLSGLVITYVADQKEPSLDIYAASRFARLWSVLLPALVVTYVADLLGNLSDPSAYMNWGGWIATDGEAWRLIPSALFVNELWFASIPPLSNGPVWSLGFEFWYYVIFGAAWYLRGITRSLVVVLGCAIAGPRILMLFPVWLLGVGVYSAVSRWRAPELFGWVLFFVPIILIVALTILKIDGRLIEAGNALLGEGPGRWKSTQPFIWSYVCGIAIAAHFLGASAIDRPLNLILRPVASVIRNAAGLTLSIYLFHAPLMLLVSASLHAAPIGLLRTIITLVVTICGCVALGLACEPQRYTLRRLLLRIAFRKAVPKT